MPNFNSTKILGDLTVTGSTKVAEYTVTIPAASWAQLPEGSGNYELFYKADVTVNGLSAEDNPIVELDLTNETNLTLGDVVTAYREIFGFQVISNGTFRAYAVQAPTQNITVYVKVV